ncbi:hypothetical protein ACWFRF_05030 [Nocardia sp. NPDC055165]|uniref:hypothetical protein n=1 Tax=Nocardia sp. NPDC060220 TaxID=3347076 RepID=UPI00365DCC18
MPLPPVGPAPNISQTHEVATQHGYGATVDIARPTSGEAVTQVRCGACGEVGVYRVFDAKRTLTLRNRWRALIAGSVAVAVGFFIAAIAVLPDPFSGPGLALCAGIFIAAVACVVFRNLLSQEDGVRIDKDATTAANRVEFNFVDHDLKFLRRGRIQ